MTAAASPKSDRHGSAGHAALMDTVYRRQKHIYDLTRKYYLFGRDRLIAGLNCHHDQRVLELGCGTGRNLALIARRWRDARLFGLDISAEMLNVAAGRLGDRAVLAAADATNFSPEACFDEAAFDRIAISYALSMIPAWQDTVFHAASLLAPGGSLHIVDFGDLGGLPRPLQAALRGWLAKFHVVPRDELGAVASEAARRHGLLVSTTRGPFGYYQLITLVRP